MGGGTSWERATLASRISCVEQYTGQKDVSGVFDSELSRIFVDRTVAKALDRREDSFVFADVVCMIVAGSNDDGEMR